MNFTKAFMETITFTDAKLRLTVGTTKTMNGVAQKDGPPSLPGCCG